MSDSPGLDTDELANLRWHWDTAYDINCAGGAWTAQPFDGAAPLVATTAEELRYLIRADYHPRPATASGERSDAAAAGSMGPGERALRQLRDDGLI
jgi:hypothetical protein